MWLRNRRSLSVLSGISEDLLVSSSIGHEIGGTSHAALVDSLVRTNVVPAGSRLEAALRRVDRGDFMSPLFRASKERYANRPLKIGTEATISTPQHHAQVLRALEPHLQLGMTAVDVGCGSGVLVAAMAHLVGPLGSVTGVEIVPDLVTFSIENLQRSLGEEVAAKQTRILLSTGKKDLGLPAGSQYDCIHVGVAVETKAEAERFLEYLKPGGGLMIPLGGLRTEQKLVKVRPAEIQKGTNDMRTPMLDSAPVEIVHETRAENLERVEKALVQWREDFEAKNGRKPTRDDLTGNADAHKLFQDFAALRK
uniref:protein-L-isoaspartate(D-aspartate) O-methyltransferase n=1 Tax=Hyaloperonospora arabidopsidis (strain Emoy2) TaxID=559515 RepID=M4BKW9_HYAAE